MVSLSQTTHIMRDRYQSGRGGGIHRYFKYFTFLIILGIAGMAAFHFFIAKPIKEMGSIDKLARALGSVTDSEVKVDGYTLTLDSAETRELIVVKRRTQTVVKFESTWLGSKKVFILKGDFEIKAGFDLSEFDGFELEGSKAVGEWPEPRLLGVSLLNYDTFFSSSGTFNRISEKDREHATNMLHQQARIDAIQNSDILQEAEHIIRTRLEDLTDGEIEFEKKLN
jgi:hypothetical protein